jgi:putative NADH-flavin reductase
MKIGIIGANGKAGSLILKEAIDRGHEVTAIVRDASKMTNQQVAVLEKDIFNLTAEDVKVFDVVVNAFGAPQGQEHLHVESGKKLIDILSGLKTRLIVVGGAGSLFVDEAKTLQLFNTPDFPELYHATAKNMGENLNDLQNTTSVNWTYISPSAFFDPQGPRTGSYKTETDRLLVNSEGKSYLSYADFSIALLDEIESPKHLNERFTVGSESK